MAEDINPDIPQADKEFFTFEELAVKFPGYRVLAELAFNRDLSVQYDEEQSERMQRIDELGTGTPPMVH